MLLSGVNGEQPPTERGEALEWARTLGSPVVADVMETSHPVGEPVTHRFPSDQRRHVERLRRFPLGWLPLGDAVCSFNPLYGQGMTVAAQQARALGDQLERRGAVDRTLARRYFRAAGSVVDDPWQIAVGGDFAYDGTSGPKPPGTDLIGRYMGRLAVAAQHDDLVALRLKEVASLERSPRSLLSPRVLVRGLRGARQGPLRDRGYEVTAVGSTASEVAGEPAYPSLAAVPGPLDGVIVMVHRDRAVPVVREAIELGIPRVWLFKGVGGAGSVSPEAVELCRSNGVAVVPGACPLMFLGPVAAVHRIHRGMRHLNGSLGRSA